MHRSPLLVAIAFVITTPGWLKSKSLPTPPAGLPALALAQTQNELALKSFMPLRVENAGEDSLTVKVVGPTMKTLKLGPSENQVVIVAPGEYYCLYRFKGGPSDPVVFKKTGKFQVASPAPDKPTDHIRVLAGEEDRPPEETKGEIREVRPSSAKEFSDADVSFVPLASHQATLENTDSLRLNNLSVIMIVGDLAYGETEAQQRQQEKLVVGQLNQYVRGVLLPKLGRQGFKVKFLGVRDEVLEETPTEPTLVIDYSEIQGRGYAMYSGYGQPMAHGVEISCSLTLYHPSILRGQGVWDASLSASNDESIKINILSDFDAALHMQALRYLRLQLNDLVLDLVDWAPRTARAAAGPARTGSTRSARSSSRKR